MTGPEHYQAAEKLLKRLSGQDPGSPWYHGITAAAQVHATLAVAAATAMSHWNSPDMPMPQPDRLAWEKAASERPAAQAREKAAREAEAAEFSGEGS